MALINNEERYIEAVKELYPEGSFFEEQFADKESDLSNLARAQAKNLYDFRIELNKLWKEARLETCSEDTIADYERVYSGKTNPHLSLEERKANLKLVSNQSLQIDWQLINNYINEEYKANILSVDEKIMPAFFGDSRCGQKRIYDYRAFSLLIISLTIEEINLIDKIENYINQFLLANKIIFFKIINNINKE